MGAISKLPARKNPLPVRIHVRAHFGLIIALAKRKLSVALCTSSELIPIEIDAQARLIRNADHAVGYGHATTGDYLVEFGLPRIMRVAGMSQMRRGGRGVGHYHHADAEVVVGMHRNAESKYFAKRGQLLLFADPAPIMWVGKNDLDGILAPGARNMLEACDGD